MYLTGNCPIDDGLASPWPRLLAGSYGILQPRTEQGDTPERLNYVNAYVDTTMATADEQIRVSGRVKRHLDRRRREGESYNDVLERLLEAHGEADFYEGFGILSDETADWIRTKREAAKAERKRRLRESGGRS